MADGGQADTLFYKLTHACVYVFYRKGVRPSARSTLFPLYSSTVFVWIVVVTLFLLPFCLNGLNLFNFLSIIRRLPLQIVSITLPLRFNPATISRPLRTSTSRLFPLFLPFLISVQYCRILSGYPFLIVPPIANRHSG